jgi:nucleoside-diphosphate-sugar epimerase
VVAQALLPLLAQRGFESLAFSRASHPLPAGLASGEPPIDAWISTVPMWVLPDMLEGIARLGARRVVAVSSTSRYTKTDSGETRERETAAKLARGEAQLIDWAQRTGTAWTILRPTLIYGLGIDRNVCDVARFIRRFGFFPVLGEATGLRQPVHMQDVAQACIAALTAPAAANRDYNVSGGEVLTYREMVRRVFAALGRTPRLVAIPLDAFRWTIAALRVFPRFRGWSASMAVRMNEDLVFDHADAARDLDFRPRAFELAPADLPK